jgi:integrase
VFLYNGLRREELCGLKVRDIQQRRSVPDLRVHGKGNKVRYLPLQPGTAELIAEYMEAVGNGNAPKAPLFRPVKNTRNGNLEEAITPDGSTK